jgi:RNA polymerase sigma-70 factor (family 1)
LLNPEEQEKGLLLELLKGNEDAFEKIYHLYSSRLFARLMKLVKLESQAEEILQDVFLKLWESRRSIDPEKSFHSFLFKIAENKVYDFFRKAARDKSMEIRLIALSAANPDNFDEFKSGDENLSILQKAIESLPPQRQQVFRLCKLEGKSYKEVSELLGISVSTISDHIVKGTKLLRDYFDNNNQYLIISGSILLTRWSLYFFYY